ncbi:MAG: hypothetical protein J7599_24200 [Niabella sp.]|nr:hypothetical protein [Niabella sp.]
MKTTLIFTCLLLLSAKIINAQTWSGSTPGNIYYNQGAVGIGTSSPNSTLHIKEQSTSGGIITVENYQSDSRLGGLHFASGYDNFQSWSGIEAYGTGGVDQQDLRFSVSYGTRREAMRIAPSANVGIGTAAPNTKLHVLNGAITVGIDNGYGGEIFLGNSNHGLKRTNNNVTMYTDGGDGNLVFNTVGSNERMRITPSGNIGMGTASPTERLSVNGKIRAQEIRVDAGPWPDYVFRPGYDLKPLDSLRKEIQTLGHLPGMPDAKNVEQEGAELGMLVRALVEKNETLTLYLLQQHDQIKKLQKQVATLTAKKAKAKYR